MACFTNQNGGEAVNISPGNTSFSFTCFIIVLNKVFMVYAMLNLTPLGKNWCMVKKDSQIL